MIIEQILFDVYMPLIGENCPTQQLDTYNPKVRHRTGSRNSRHERKENISERANWYPQRKIRQSSNKYQGESATCVSRQVFKLTSSNKERNGDDGGQHAP